MENIALIGFAGFIAVLAIGVIAIYGYIKIKYRDTYLKKSTDRQAHIAKNKGEDCKH